MAKGLGRGLNAFFGEDEENAIEQVTKKSSKKEDNVLEKVIELKIDEIEPMLNQPRKVFNQEKMDELTNSIRENGVIQPILVVKDKESNTNVCKFKVLSGDVIEEREEVEGGDDIPDTIQIFNKEGIYLFSIERKNRTETRLSVEELYRIRGIQWFESGADNYHKLIDVNPDLQDKQKPCKQRTLRR